MVELRGGDTTPTEEDGILDQLRREGILGPFVISDRAGGSDVGMVREANEDSWATDGERVFVIADGIGGHAGGALASRTAVEVAVSHSAALTEPSAGALVARANGAVLHAGELAGLPQLGTTLVVLVAHRNHVLIVSVGDSRAYRLRGGELEQLTRDHTVRNELIAAGVSPDVAHASKIRLDALTSHIGRPGDGPVAHHTASYSVMAGDRFLLCTDGLHGQLDAGEIARIVSAGSCQDAVAGLLAAATQAGGRDNATAVIVEFASAGGAS